MEQMVVERRVGREHCRHLVVIRRMDVLINTVARELHLQREGRIRSITGLSRVGANITCQPRVGARGERTDQVCRRLTRCQGQDLGLSLQLTPWPHAEVETCSGLQGSGLSLHPHLRERPRAQAWAARESEPKRYTGGRIN